MENFIYAQLDSENYCIGISQLSGEVIQDNLIRLEEFDSSYMGRLYDMENQVWTDTYRPTPEEEEEDPNALTEADYLMLSLVEQDLLK